MKRAAMECTPRPRVLGSVRSIYDWRARQNLACHPRLACKTSHSRALWLAPFAVVALVGVRAVVGFPQGFELEAIARRLSRAGIPTLSVAKAEDLCRTQVAPEFWLPPRDSNPDNLLQRQVS